MRQTAGVSAGWRPSPNFDERRAGFVVIHYTGDQSTADALRTLTDPATQVSAHYLIGPDGDTLQLVDERARAWHAGDSRWGADLDLNSTSIGVELVNNGLEPYPAAQIDALLRLLGDLRRRHRLSPAGFLGHADVAPKRKTDPGARFPWRLLATRGFGLWCDPPYRLAPLGFDPLLGLRAIGYDISVPESAVTAFRIHHLPSAPTTAPLERDSDLIACLLQQSLQR